MEYKKADRIWGQEFDFSKYVSLQFAFASFDLQCILT